MPCKEEGFVYSNIKNAIIGTSFMHVANTRRVLLFRPKVYKWASFSKHKWNIS